VLVVVYNNIPIPGRCSDCLEIVSHGRAMSDFPLHTLARSCAGVIAVIYVVYTREDATVQEEESPAQSARRLAVCTTDTLRDEAAAARKKNEGKKP